MHVLLSLADPEPGEPPPPIYDTDCWPREPESPPPARPRVRRLGARRLAQRGQELLANPPGGEHIARLGLDAASAVHALLLSPPDSDTVLRGTPSVAKSAAWSGPLPLLDIKSAGKRLDGTVNDVLLAAVTGAIRRYLQANGESLVDAQIRALVPISLRPSGAAEELGNRIGIVALPMPVDVAGPLNRFHELKRRMDEFKGTLEAPVVYAAMNTFGRSPSTVIKPFVDHLCKRATLVVTNVKGPQEPLYLAGAPLEEFMFWIPRYGGIGLGIGLLSYNGQVRVGVISDRDVVPDPEAVIDTFHQEFDALLAQALELEPPPSIEDVSTRLDDALASMDRLLAGDAGADGPAKTPIDDTS
jgi:WS/DGAT/MGAT family acyltransferase